MRPLTSDRPVLMANSQCQGQRTIPLAWPRTKSPVRPWSFARSAVPRTADDPARLAADEIASQGVEFRPLGRAADSGRSRPPAVRVLIGRQRRPAYAPSHRCRPLRHTALDVHDFEPWKLLEYPLAHHADEMGHKHSGTAPCGHRHCPRTSCTARWIVSNSSSRFSSSMQEKATRRSVGPSAIVPTP